MLIWKFSAEFLKRAQIITHVFYSIFNALPFSRPTNKISLLTVNENLHGAHYKLLRDNKNTLGSLNTYCT